ncbi:MAG: phosphoribosylaminoimidazolesuccinocarboxamide synthase [Deltaproteobacteria bacterium]|nr:phosphoribosylaminoimidazolesuccinocarboxamide synthase [Deltaproteobacteria bacterium]MBW2382170.1 phosphoribosylaminoimidazolesuccinocarboxamide synthase [Deltaproteobacteria bacterium]
MTLDDRQLEELCSRTLERTDFPELGEKHTGKVRDSYVKGRGRTIVVTDRVSAFDVVIGTIPLKGQILNQMAAFWFHKLSDIAPNHLIDVPDPCVSRVHECKLLPVEFVYRGYLTGSTKTSIWTAYESGQRSYCGHELPGGLRRHERLPEPLLTPTTKADLGGHDELTSKAAIIEGGTMSEELYAEAERITSELFEAGTHFAKERGLILVDTKYELGLDENGDIVVIDEIHTPDSSRYWHADTYDAAMSRGESPQAIDKEYVRLWLGEQGYRGEGQPPELTTEVRCEAARRYVRAYEQVSGLTFEPDLEEPTTRIRRNLGI